MKLLSKILLLAFMATIFVSCGDDDNEPKPNPVTESKTHTYTLDIKGIANQPQANVKTTLTLTDAVGATIANNLISADFQRGKSSLEIKGLKNISETAKIKDFTIKVGSRNAVNLGTCTFSPGVNEFNSDIELDDDKYTNVVKDIFDDLNANKKVDVALSFTTDMDMSSGVQLNIKTTGNYKYYPVK